MRKQVNYFANAECIGNAVLGLATEVGKPTLLERKEIIQKRAILIMEDWIILSRTAEAP
ncbi:MAG: hypothetical protein JKY49_03095 [Cohaesibacteraceae bacterium]|nr:hypothetical protein [Cohaesibacteraceae bacterium]MBL4875249.1 hypothetical protein [Cohaesibacteraceae bacterium]